MTYADEMGSGVMTYVPRFIILVQPFRSSWEGGFIIHSIVDWEGGLHVIP
jgi:hypothetical protein